MESDRIVGTINIETPFETIRSEVGVDVPDYEQLIEGAREKLARDLVEMAEYVKGLKPRSA